MDFANLDLRAASERGVWVHLKYDGKALYAGDDPTKPCRVKVLGMAAPAVLSSFRKIERIEMMRVQFGKPTDEQLIEVQTKLEAAIKQLIIAGLSSWENIIYAGEHLGLTPDNVLTICGPGTLFFDQVRDAMTDQKLLFTEAANG